MKNNLSRLFWICAWSSWGVTVVDFLDLDGEDLTAFLRSEREMSSLVGFLHTRGLPLSSSISSSINDEEAEAVRLALSVFMADICYSVYRTNNVDY